MSVVEWIAQKRDGQELAPEALEALVGMYTRDEVPDYQMAAFLMAVYFRSMTPAELGAWTRAMLHSGSVLDLDEIPGHKIDKHSTGGVGDKVSLILAPLAAAAGLRVPMVAGRGLGHTGGTLDKLESIPGFSVQQPVDDFRRIVREVGCAIIGQTEQIAPADKRLYALRDVTATVPCIPLIASSIMSKKLAEGIDALVLDVKVGSGAFMKDMKQARELARTMVAIGAEMDRPVRALITDMSQPLGRAVGNSLEVAECIEVMRGGGPEDLVELTVELVAEMLRAADPTTDEEDPKTRQLLREMLDSGHAMEIFARMVEAQGGDPAVCDDPDAVLPQATHQATFDAPRAGRLVSCDCQGIGLAAVALGAGRQKKEDVIDPAVGFVFHKRLGEEVDTGEPICTIHYNDEARYQAAVARLEQALKLAGEGEGQASYEPVPLIRERIVS